MNAVEIEEAISKLAAEPFDPATFPYAFLEAFGNKAATIQRLKSGNTNKTDIEGAVLQYNNIHIAVSTAGDVLKTLSRLKDSRLLIQKTDLPFQDIFALDRIQKKLPVSDEALGHLRRAGLVEGRKPNLHVSALVAAVTDNKAEYIRTRAQDDAHYAKLILDYLQKFGQASRQEIDALLKKHLSEALNDYQKSRKIGNLLSNLRRSGHIHNAGSRGNPIWKLAERRNAE